MADTSDNALREVVDAIRALDPTGSQWANVIRHTYDSVYNGQETGRYRWDQLMKTEKTHFGSLFEIYVQRRFKFGGGTRLDFLIAGHEVDAKWSQSYGGWMLPPEVFGELALVCTANDQESLWSLGVVRATSELRRTSENRDRKGSLNQAGRDAIHWIWRNETLPSNVLLQLEPTAVDFIFSLPDGTQRLNQLFRAAEGRFVNRTTVQTVAQQLDSQKRVRGNGGSRSALAREGFLILSGKYHGHLAAQLGVPTPSGDEYISVRVVPTSGEAGAVIGDQRWRRAVDGDVVSAPAPELPARGSRE